ncbi:hypothetical protein JG687_00017879 [Phytophthora cactorum]|uniref:Uncharacterized protein n=1 Tax=Phytophthora cactorum TaxID=29920 RepID=A0A8T1TLW1_9STRA|nr:hypothetical protein PC120_g22684 [Phytophthora cactorum]KAG3045089.1 hypothetical protein PC121_g21496 [Phytophthora cactorum]KAG6944436.1 hypothetical protein JG687_00017879 [Phytophthora cactorum]
MLRSERQSIKPTNVAREGLGRGISRILTTRTADTMGHDPPDKGPPPDGGTLTVMSQVSHTGGEPRTIVDEVAAVKTNDVTDVERPVEDNSDKHLAARTNGTGEVQTKVEGTVVSKPAT